MSSSSKFARGTGRGQSRLAPPQKRGIIPLRQGPPLKDRAALGPGKDGTGYISAGNGGITSNGQEENYQLLAPPAGMGRPFAMMIRLTPEILEELKQAEAEGNNSKMKFGANAAGHVIKVGPEDFQFSSAPEPGELCDIYEQRSREDGEVLLVETGSVWRKLSVQRILSATEKDRVKKRTAEAEKKQKLRKSILVDPSTQMIIPQAAPVEANGRKPMLKTKKEPPPKKRKVTMSPVTSSAKQRPQINASGLIGNHRIPASPSPEPPNAGVRGASLTQIGGMHPPKERPSVTEGFSGPPATSKGNSALQKEKIQPAASNAGNEGGGALKMGSAAHMTELRNFLITLLKENPKGVTIKAVEKAIGEGMPTNPGKKLVDKVLKSIAYFCAPGKYFLNPGVEKGSFLEVTPATSEQVSERIHELSVARTREEETSAGANREANKEEEACERSSDIDVLNVGSHQSPTQHSLVKEISVQPAEPHLHDLSKTKATSPKPNAVDAKEGSSEGTDSGSSSGSESDSDSDSSESGSGSDSGSGSGSTSDSEASSSSSDANMDEDVDIMSDDENENKSDSRQKPKGKETKSVSTKQDGKVHKEDSLAREGSESKSVDKQKSIIEDLPFHSLESITTSKCVDIHDATEPVSLGAPDNLIEKVFGPDEDTDVRVDANVPSGDVGSKVLSELQDLSSTYTKQVKFGTQSGNHDRTHVNNPEGKRKSSWKAQGNQEENGKNGFDQDSNIGEIEFRASKRGRQSNLSEEMNFQEKDATNNNMRHVKSRSPVTQLESKSPIRSVGAATSKGTDKHLIRSEAGGNNILGSNRRDRSSTVNDDVVSSRTLSLEATKMKPDGSPLRVKDNLQKVGRSFFEEGVMRQAPVKQHPHLEIRKSFPKNMDTGEKYSKDAEKHDTEKKASETVITGKSPDDLVKISHRSARNPECTSRQLEEGVITVRTPDRSIHRGARLEQSGILGKDDDNLPKEKVSERSLSKSTKAGETLGRHIKDAEAQRWQQKDPASYGGASKVNANRFNKESDQSSGYDRDLLQSARPNKESSKVLRPNRQLDEYKSNDYIERAVLITEQAERPMREVDILKRGKDTGARDSLKESEVIGRPPLNGVPLSLLKEGKKSEVDTGPLESRKAFPRCEDSRSRQVEVTSRAVSKKGSISPDIEKSSIGRSLNERMKRSPVKVGTDPGRSSHDTRNGKRRLEDERAETERPPKKKLPSAQARQPNHSKQDRFSVSSGNEEAIEKTRPSTSDVQDHIGSSIRNSMSENSRKQASKDWGENKVATLIKQKTNSAPVVANEKCRDNPKPEFAHVSAKKQTPQSSEVQGAEFFAPYEKKEPELRGPINSYEQYKEYCKEYKEKYPIYIRLNASLESDKEDFESLRKEIELAKCKDDKHKLNSIYGKVKKDYFRCRKRFKRMRQTFGHLHEELQVIKHRCKEYAEKVGQG